MEVGTAEFRRQLAAYLKLARAGQEVVIQERGHDAYLLVRLAASPPPSVFGGMRDDTDYDPDVILNAEESWEPGSLP